MKVKNVYVSNDPYLHHYRWNPLKCWPLIFLAVAGGLFALSIAVFETIMWLMS